MFAGGVDRIVLGTMAYTEPEVTQRLCDTYPGKIVIGTVQGVGGSLSNVVAGAIVVAAGYGLGFLVLAAFASLAFLLVLLAMPETCTPTAPGRRQIGVE